LLHSIPRLFFVVHLPLFHSPFPQMHLHSCCSVVLTWSLLFNSTIHSGHLLFYCSFLMRWCWKGYNILCSPIYDFSDYLVFDVVDRWFLFYIWPFPFIIRYSDDTFGIPFPLPDAHSIVGGIRYRSDHSLFVVLHCSDWLHFVPIRFYLVIPMHWHSFYRFVRYPHISLLFSCSVLPFVFYIPSSIYLILFCCYSIRYLHFDVTGTSTTCDAICSISRWAFIRCIYSDTLPPTTTTFLPFYRVPTFIHWISVFPADVYLQLRFSHFTVPVHSPFYICSSDTTLIPVRWGWWWSRYSVRYYHLHCCCCHLIHSATFPISVRYTILLPTVIRCDTTFPISIPTTLFDYSTLFICWCWWFTDAFFDWPFCCSHFSALHLNIPDIPVDRYVFISTIRWCHLPFIHLHSTVMRCNTIPAIQLLTCSDAFVDGIRLPISHSVLHFDWCHLFGIPTHLFISIYLRCDAISTCSFTILRFYTCLRYDGSVTFLRATFSFLMRYIVLRYIWYCSHSCRYHDDSPIPLVTDTTLLIHSTLCLPTVRYILLTYIPLQRSDIYIPSPPTCSIPLLHHVIPTPLPPTDLIPIHVLVCLFIYYVRSPPTVIIYYIRCDAITICCYILFICYHSGDAFYILTHSTFNYTIYSTHLLMHSMLCNFPWFHCCSVLFHSDVTDKKKIVVRYIHFVHSTLGAVPGWYCSVPFCSMTPFIVHLRLHKFRAMELFWYNWWCDYILPRCSLHSLLTFHVTYHSVVVVLRCWPFRSIVPGPFYPASVPVLPFISTTIHFPHFWFLPPLIPILYYIYLFYVHHIPFSTDGCSHRCDTFRDIYHSVIHCCSLYSSHFYCYCSFTFVPGVRLFIHSTFTIPTILFVWWSIHTYRWRWSVPVLLHSPTLHFVDLILPVVLRLQWDDILFILILMMTLLRAVFIPFLFVILVFVHYSPTIFLRYIPTDCYSTLLTTFGIYHWPFYPFIHCSVLIRYIDFDSDTKLYRGTIHTMFVTFIFWKNFLLTLFHSCLPVVGDSHDSMHSGVVVVWCWPVTLMFYIRYIPLFIPDTFTDGNFPVHGHFDTTNTIHSHSLFHSTILRWCILPRYILPHLHLLQHSILHRLQCSVVHYVFTFVHSFLHSTDTFYHLFVYYHLHSIVPDTLFWCCLFLFCSFQMITIRAGVLPTPFTLEKTFLRLHSLMIHWYSRWWCSDTFYYIHCCSLPTWWFHSLHSFIPTMEVFWCPFIPPFGRILLRVVLFCSTFIPQYSLLYWCILFLLIHCCDTLILIRFHFVPRRSLFYTPLRYRYRYGSVVLMFCSALRCSVFYLSTVRWWSTFRVLFTISADASILLFLYCSHLILHSHSWCIPILHSFYDTIRCIRDAFLPFWYRICSIHSVFRIWPDVLLTIHHCCSTWCYHHSLIPHSFIRYDYRYKFYDVTTSHSYGDTIYDTIHLPTCLFVLDTLLMLSPLFPHDATIRYVHYCCYNFLLPPFPFLPSLLHSILIRYRYHIPFISFYTGVLPHSCLMGVPTTTCSVFVVCSTFVIHLRSILPVFILHFCSFVWWCLIPPIFTPPPPHSHSLHFVPTDKVFPVMIYILRYSFLRPFIHLRPYHSFWYFIPGDDAWKKITDSGGISCSPFLLYFVRRVFYHCSIHSSWLFSVIRSGDAILRPMHFILVLFDTVRYLTLPTTLPTTYHSFYHLLFCSYLIHLLFSFYIHSFIVPTAICCSMICSCSIPHLFLIPHFVLPIPIHHSLRWAFVDAIPILFIYHFTYHLPFVDAFLPFDIRYSTIHSWCILCSVFLPPLIPIIYLLPLPITPPFHSTIVHSLIGRHSTIPTYIIYIHTTWSDLFISGDVTTTTVLLMFLRLHSDTTVRLTSYFIYILMTIFWCPFRLFWPVIPHYGDLLFRPIPSLPPFVGVLLLMRCSHHIFIPTITTGIRPFCGDHFWRYCSGRLPFHSDDALLLFLLFCSFPTHWHFPLFISFTITIPVLPTFYPVISILIRYFWYHSYYIVDDSLLLPFILPFHSFDDDVRYNVRYHDPLYSYRYHFYWYHSHSFCSTIYILFDHSDICSTLMTTILIRYRCTRPFCLHSVHFWCSTQYDTFLMGTICCWYHFVTGDYDTIPHLFYTPFYLRWWWRLLFLPLFRYHSSTCLLFTFCSFITTI